MLRPFCGSPLFWNARPKDEDEGEGRYLCLRHGKDLQRDSSVIPVQEKLFIVPISYQTWGVRLPRGDNHLEDHRVGRRRPRDMDMAG